MSKVEVAFLGGESVLNGMLTSIFGMEFKNFLIGDVAGFVPTGTETTVKGNTTFIGNQSDIKIKMFDEGRSARISMLLAGDYDDVTIGNVVLFAKTPQGIKPLLMMVLPEKVYKNNTASDILQQGFPYPETRLIISVTIKYINANELQTNYTVDIITPEVANLPFFGSDLDVPEGVANPWSQFIVNSMHVAGGTPALVTKDVNDLYYTTPLFQNLDHPEYGILRGGVPEDPDNRIQWIWGLRYITPDNYYSGVIGGVDYEADLSNIETVGGEPY